MDLPYRGRSVMADDAGKYRDAAAVARGNRGTCDHRLSSAGDARGNRGNPRSNNLEGNAGCPAGNRMDTPARPPQDAGPSADVRNHGSFPLAVQPGSAWRSAGA